MVSMGRILLTVLYVTLTPRSLLVQLLRIMVLLQRKCGLTACDNFWSIYPLHLQHYTVLEISTCLTFYYQ